MAWQLPPEVARRRRAAVAAVLRARQEGARAAARSSADPARCRRAYRRLVAENAASTAPPEPSPKRAQPTRARACHQPAAIRFRRDCRAPSQARLPAGPRGARSPARPAPKPRQRRRPQRVATGPAERQRPARMTPSNVRLKALRARARRFASWDRQRPRYRGPTRDHDPVHPRPRVLPIGMSFAGCTGPLKKACPRHGRRQPVHG